jgi:Tol biopolymer transport system component
MHALRSLIASVFLISMVAAQVGEIAPNENLVVDGIPKIPAALAESIERYSNFRAANLTSWHPTRRELLISTRFADVPEIHRVTMPGGDRTQLTFYPDAVTSAQYEPTEGKYFVFSKDVGGGEFYQLYRYDLDSGDVTLLTDGKSRNTSAIWWDQGRKPVYGSTRRTGKMWTCGSSILRIRSPIIW